MAQTLEQKLRKKLRNAQERRKIALDLLASRQPDDAIGQENAMRALREAEADIEERQKLIDQARTT